MKTFIILLACVAAVLANPSGILKRRQGECPPTPDPSHIEAGPLNLTLNPLLTIDVGGTHEEVMISGHSTLLADVQFILLTSNLLFDVTVPAIEIDCLSYEATGYIDVRPIRAETFVSGNFTSSGSPAKLSFTNVHLVGKVNVWVILITNRVQLRDLEVSVLEIESAFIHLGDNYMVNGEKADFDAINENLLSNFMQDWASNKQAILNRILEAINIIVKTMTLDELLDLILNPGEPEC